MFSADLYSSAKLGLVRFLFKTYFANIFLTHNDLNVVNLLCACMVRLRPILDTFLHYIQGLTVYASMQDCGTKMYVCARNSMLNFTTDVLWWTSKKTNLFLLFPWKNLFLSSIRKIDYHLGVTCIWVRLSLRLQLNLLQG